MMENQFDPKVMETAAYWALRISQADSSPVERSAFEAWRNECPMHNRAFLRAQETLNIVDRNLSRPEISELGDRVFRETEPKKNPIRESWLGIAAATALIAVGGLVGIQTLTPSSDSYLSTNAVSSAASSTNQGSYETAVGERTTVVLSDGSRVTLNTDTRISADFGGPERKIVLLKGQALFEVTKSTRPFVVQAGDQRVTALGTAFDVHLDGNSKVEVVLLEGSVAIDRAPPGSLHAAGSNVAPEDRIILEPGERLVAAVNTPRAAELVDIELATSWRTGRLIFRDTTLDEVVHEVNRYSVRKLRLGNDPQLKDIRISGVFNSGHSENFASALEVLHPVDVQLTSDNEYIVYWAGN